MKALVKSQPAAGLWMESVDTPQIQKSNEVKIKIRKAAICGTDSHIWKWDQWAQDNVKVNTVIGHEYVGEIVEVGAAVTQHQVGDRVSGEGHIACGQCRNCLTGNAHVCAKTVGVGVNRNGAFAEYLVIPEANVRALPSSITDEIASILDPLGNAVHTALAYDLVGEDVLITGAGPIGCMAVAVCRFVGARHIVITDQNPERLKLAENMGASLGIEVKDWDKAKIVEQLGMKEGFDVGLEMSGAAPALNTLIESMNTNGKVALLGLFADKPTLDLNAAIFKGITFKGIYGRRMYDTWHKMLAMLESGLDVSPIISHEFEFDDFAAAFDMALSGKANKVLLSFDTISA